MGTIIKHNRMDAKFEKLLSNVLHEVDRSEFTPEKRAQRRAAAAKSDLAFASIYYSKIFDSPFNDVHRHIAGLQAGKYTVSGFPMSGKSAFTFVGKIIKHMVMGERGIANITLRTQDIAKERTFQLYRLMVHNELLNYDFDINVQQAQKGFYIINNKLMVATSVETGLRNFVDDDFKRFAISVADDTYNRISASSQNDNEKTTDFITGELYRQMEPDGLSIVLGNRINEDCPIVRMEKIFPETHFSFPIINEKGQSNWPERYSIEDIGNLEAETEWEVWQGEYLDRPAVRGNIFKADWLRSINVNTVEIKASISVCDPSHGSSPAACNKAIATAGTTGKETVVLDFFMRKDPYPKVFDYVTVLRARLPNWKAFLFENDFAQWNMAEPYYRSWMDDRNDSLPIVKFNSKENTTELRGADKDSRIMGLVYPHETGLIIYDERVTKTRDYEKFKSEYLSFGKAKTKLDGLDALSAAYILLKRYVTTGGFKQLKKRKMKKPRWFRRG